MKQSEAENMDDEDFRKWWINELCGMTKYDLIQLFINDHYGIIEVDA